MLYVEDNVRKRAARFLLFSFNRFLFSNFMLWFFVIVLKNAKKERKNTYEIERYVFIT